MGLFTNYPNYDLHAKLDDLYARIEGLSKHVGYVHDEVDDILPKLKTIAVSDADKDVRFQRGFHETRIRQSRGYARLNEEPESFQSISDRLDKSYRSIGDLVYYTGKHGSDLERERAEKAGLPGYALTVCGREVGAWSHSYTFIEFPGQWFNGVMFDVAHIDQIED